MLFLVTFLWPEADPTRLHSRVAVAVQLLLPHLVVGGAQLQWSSLLPFCPPSSALAQTTNRRQSSHRSSQVSPKTRSSQETTRTRTTPPPPAALLLPRFQLLLPTSPLTGEGRMVRQHPVSLEVEVSMVQAMVTPHRCWGSLQMRSWVPY